MGKNHAGRGEEYGEVEEARRAPTQDPSTDIARVCRPRRLDQEQVQGDLDVKAIWLVVHDQDKDSEMAHYFFRHGKPLAALQYLEKPLRTGFLRGMRLSLVARPALPRSWPNFQAPPALE